VSFQSAKGNKGELIKPKEGLTGRGTRFLCKFENRFHEKFLRIYFSRYFCSMRDFSRNSLFHFFNHDIWD